VPLPVPIGPRAVQAQDERDLLAAFQIAWVVDEKLRPVFGSTAVP
jgi:hypothetical protein